MFQAIYTKIYNWNYRVKAIRTDAEYLFVEDQRFIDWCNAVMIERVNSPPHIHQRNGFIERGIQYVLNQTRKVINADNCPKKVWPLAFKYVQRILNCTPQANLDKTPWEIVHGESPDLSTFFPFNAKGFYHVTMDERRGKREVLS